MMGSPVQAIEMDWWTLDAGGVLASGIGVELHGTLAQPDAVALSVVGSGVDDLRGGFWPAPADRFETPFLDDFESNVSR